MSGIRAEYVNFKNVMSREVFQIILEVPANETEQVFKILGRPTAHESKYVAVALLGEPEPDAALEEPNTILGAG